MAVALAISVLPVLLFLGALVLLDSYKLIPFRAILLAVAAGCAAAAAGYAVNSWVRPAIALDLVRYSKYVAPIVEELLKAVYVVWLIRRSKVGFVADAATYGFAAGTGFALVENLLLLQGRPSATIWAWVVRGFGTALMHGTTTALFAAFAHELAERESREAAGSFDFRWWWFVPGYIVAVLLHMAFNLLGWAAMNFNRRGFSRVNTSSA